jgi:hypothetical protein
MRVLHSIIKTNETWPAIILRSATASSIRRLRDLLLLRVRQASRLDLTEQLNFSGTTDHPHALPVVR